MALLVRPHHVHSRGGALRRVSAGPWRGQSGLDRRRALSFRMPAGPYDDLILADRVIEVRGQAAQIKAAQLWQARARVGRPDTCQNRQKSNGLVDLLRNNLWSTCVLAPPPLDRSNLRPRGLREADMPAFHGKRSSFNTTAASIRRSPATSSSEASSARCSASRSSSSSQSPGSSGNRDSSVPSGRSVGSSTTKRPFRTRAVTVMPEPYHRRATGPTRVVGACSIAG